MSNILSLTEFEAAFQSLQFRLTLNISARLKTRFLGEFCILLQARDNPVMNHSYYQELLPHFQQVLSIESMTYQPDYLLLSLLETLQYTRSRNEFDTDSADFKECLRSVRL